MSLEDATQTVKDRVGDDVGIRKTVKVDFGKDGVIHLDGRIQPNVISNEDKDADVILRCSLKTFLDVTSGRANPQLAFVMGRLKVEGDMNLALQFGRALR